jgi:hypothetical protein
MGIEAVFSLTRVSLKEYMEPVDCSPTKWGENTYNKKHFPDKDQFQNP